MAPNIPSNPSNPSKANPQTGAGPTNKPTWWADQHLKDWDRIKDQQKRDWESGSKAGGAIHADTDVSGKAKSVESGSKTGGAQTGTSAGKPMNWHDAEPAVRYGHGAHKQYGKEHHDWDDKLENRLKSEWNDLKSGRTWQEVKDAVRRGWDAARRHT